MKSLTKDPLYKKLIELFESDEMKIITISVESKGIAIKTQNIPSLKIDRSLSECVEFTGGLKFNIVGRTKDQRLKNYELLTYPNKSNTDWLDMIGISGHIGISGNFINMYNTGVMLESIPNRISNENDISNLKKKRITKLFTTPLKESRKKTIENLLKDQKNQKNQKT